MTTHAKAREWLEQRAREHGVAEVPAGNWTTPQLMELMDAYAAHVLRELADATPEEIVLPTGVRFHLGTVSRIWLRAEAERLEGGE